MARMVSKLGRCIGCGSLLLACLLLPLESAAGIWPSAVRRAERDLSASDPQARRAAVLSLAELPRAAAGRLLLRALDDTDVQVQSAALELLLRFETPGVTERVVPWLSGTDKRLRLSAALALAVAPAPNATVALGRALGDSDAEVRAAAAAALGASQADAAVVPLLGHLDDSVPEVREAVVSALGALGDARAVVPLIGKIEDPRPGVRAAVARALGSLGDLRSTSALLLSLRDSDHGVVVAVVSALGSLGDSAAVTPLTSLLASSPETELRRALLSTLGRIGSAEAGQALAQELGFDEPGRERAAVLLALSLSPGKFTAALRSCLDSALDASQAEGCALGLAEVRDQAASARVRAALDRGRVSPRVGLSVLGRLGDASALSAALERLTATDAETRAAAMAAAEALLSPSDADGRAVEPLARALAARSVSRAERLRLVGLLGRTGSERALATLLPLLSSESDPGLSESAARALSNIPGASSARALLSAISSRESSVRRAAALSIRRVGTAELAAPLLSRLEHGGRAERSLMYLSLAGPMSAVTDDTVVRRAVALLDQTHGSERDELLEVIAAAPRPPARSALLRLAGSADPLDRAKIAELLAAQPDAATLTRLLRDPDARVRANAAWSLGFARADAALVRAELSRAFDDRDAAVVGNAAVSLGRLLRGQAALASASLCGRLLRHHQSSVREQALRGLALAQATCADGEPGRMLLSDPRAPVRRAAAELLLRQAPGPTEQRLLSRCQERDPHASVADACAGTPRAEITATEPVTLLIVPSAGAEAIPGAAFALLFSDGGLRVGSADRRGGVCELAAASGEVEVLPYTGD